MAKKKIGAEAQAIVSASDAGLYATTVALSEAFLVDHPESQRAWLDYGHALGQLSRYDAAEHAFQKALEVAVESPKDVVYGELGNLFRAKGDFESAIRWYQKQIESDPNDATGYLFLGSIWMKQGRLEDAESTLLKGLDCKHGCQEEIQYSIGLLKRSSGQLNDAKKYFESAINLDGKFMAAKLALKDVKTAISTINLQPGRQSKPPLP